MTSTMEIAIQMGISGTQMLYTKASLYDLQNNNGVCTLKSLGSVYI